ncbi:glycosyl hydrolase [Fusarium oxysporum]|nr:glycosyl hydrolase [Fusarium oxysporum]
MSQRTHLQIYPGATWTADNGQHIQAHGGGILKVGERYYWHGEDKTEGTNFRNINCYSSNDLVDWHYEGAALTRQESGDLGPERVVERPKVIFNKSTRKYVMWMHIDDPVYSHALVGVATGDTVNGQFSYHGSFRPMGCASRDMGVFVDDDDKAYLMSEDRKHGLRIFELSQDYLSVDKLVHLFPENFESPAMIKQNGLYYLFGSQLTYWYANDNKYTTATSLSGPWSSWEPFADVGTNTYDSQVTFVLPMGSGTFYLGDRWEFPQLPRSTYVWLPLNIDGTNVTMDNATSFVLDQQDGASRTRVTNKMLKQSKNGENGRNTDGDKQRLANFEFETSMESGATTLVFQYTTEGDKEQSVLVMIDNDFKQQVAFLASPGPDKVALSTVHVMKGFSKGTHSVTVVGSSGQGTDLRIDGLIIPSI